MSVHVHDSITKIGSSDTGTVVIAASHGGVYPGYLSAKQKLRGVVLSDAGVGLDRAGIASLAYLDALGIPAATVDYRSARIGDGADLERRGIISFCNRAAERLGCAAGQPARECAERLLDAQPPHAEAPSYDESRFLLRERPGEPKVWGIDSVSLARPEDAGTILVTASHGGLLGGKPATALSVDALAAVYNDAGIGIDEAGVSRLPALQARGIAAVTVNVETARIGNVRSSWKTGRISRLNEQAEKYGGRTGMSLPEFADLVVKAAR